MTPEQMEQAIEAMLAQRAEFNNALDRVRAVVERLAESQQQTSGDMRMLTGKVIELTDSLTRLEAQGEADRAEIREAINNLIIANEVTRKLSEDVAQLTVQTSQRVTAHDQRIADLESKQ